MSRQDEDFRHSFPQTEWTMVRRAGTKQAEAVGCLLERYLPALRSHLVLTRRIAPTEADDLLQEFISCKFLEENLAGQADRSRGRFRTFVLTVLDRFLIDERRRATMQKRGGEAGSHVDVHGVDIAAPGPDGPGDAFDIEWARQLLSEAIRRTEAECRASGRPDVWGVFQARLLVPMLEGRPALGYEQLVERYGFLSPVQAANALTTAKRLFRRTLQMLIGEYTDTPEAIDAEIDDLCTILSRAGAQSAGFSRIQGSGTEIS